MVALHGGWWVGVGGGGTTDAMMVIKELIDDTKLENENLFSSTCNYVYTHFCYETMLENIIIDKKKNCLVVKVQFLLLSKYVWRWYEEMQP